MLVVAACFAASTTIDKAALEFANEPTHALAQTGGLGLTLLVYLAARGELRQFAGVKEAKGLGVGMVLLALGALALQLRALQQADPSVVETIKRTIGLILSIATGRLFFGEAVARSKVVAVAFMIAGTLLLAR